MACCMKLVLAVYGRVSLFLLVPIDAVVILQRGGNAELLRSIGQHVLVVHRCSRILIISFVALQCVCCSGCVFFLRLVTTRKLT